MAKVSVGLRGWRFDEEAVLDEDGQVKPFDELDGDVKQRIVRLARLVEAPCDACWLIHGDEEIQRCNVAAVVYGEPLAEVVLCEDHEADFVYWFREDGGSEYAGEDELETQFHEWFLDGNRAPDGYGGIEHVATEQSAMPDPPEVDDEHELDEEPQTEDVSMDDVDLGQDYPS